MFGPNHYVPILKSKPAEMKALSNMSPSGLQTMTPLFEFILPSIENDKVIRAVDTFVAKVHEALGQDKPFFVDFKMVATDINVNGLHLATYVFDKLRINGLHGIPVASPSRDFNYQNAIRAIVSTDRHGLCVRMESNDFGTAHTLAGYIGVMGSSLSETDLVIDFGAIQEKSLAIIGVTLTNLISQIPTLNAWRTLTLVGSAFPSTMGQVKSATVSLLPRTEWKLWHSMYAQRHALPRLMSFGDYGIDNPELFTGFDPRIMQSSANIRYTTTLDWVIFKGRGLRTGKKNDQFFDLAQDVTKHPSYCGKTFSWGDNMIDVYAQRIPKTGSTPGTWRAIGYNHHMEFVTSQIANLSWP